MSYHLSEKADADLLLILLEGIDRFGTAQAFAYRDGMERSFELLGQHPRIGRLRTDITPRVRTLPHRSHVILYEVYADNQVLIIRIRHGREDWHSNPING